MKLKSVRRQSRPSIRTAIVSAAALFGIFSAIAFATEGNLSLTGAEEVPAVQTKATGTGMINVTKGGDVTGSVTTVGLMGTAAHVHEAAAGENGPVVFGLTKDGDIYRVPAGTKFTDAQMISYKAGNMYVNVHTKANPSGELRAQLKP